MRIDTGAQLEQIRDSGGYVVLNRQGQLETQSTFMHVMQKVADFFRSMTAGGRETIAQMRQRRSFPDRPGVRQRLRRTLPRLFLLLLTPGKRRHPLLSWRKFEVW